MGQGNRRSRRRHRSSDRGKHLGVDDRVDLLMQMQHAAVEARRHVLRIPDLLHCPLEDDLLLRQLRIQPSPNAVHLGVESHEASVNVGMHVTHGREALEVAVDGGLVKGQLFAQRRLHGPHLGVRLPSQLAEALGDGLDELGRLCLLVDQFVHVGSKPSEKDLDILRTRDLVDRGRVRRIALLGSLLGWLRHGVHGRGCEWNGSIRGLRWQLRCRMAEVDRKAQDGRGFRSDLRLHLGVLHLGVLCYQTPALKHQPEVMLLFAVVTEWSGELPMAPAPPFDWCTRKR